jgi:hypothetical protein
MQQHRAEAVTLGSRRSFLGAFALVAAAPALPRLLAPAAGAAAPATAAGQITVQSGQT